MYLRNLPTFMVPPDQRNPFRIPHFEHEEEEEGLDGVEASVDEVAFIGRGVY